MEANDNAQSRSFEQRKALLTQLVANLAPGAEGRAGFGAAYRELEQMRPGSLDQAFSRNTAKRLGLCTIDALPDLSFLDYADAPPLPIGG